MKSIPLRIGRAYSPEEGVLPDLDLKPAFTAHDEVTVFLALPVLQSGKANVAHEGRPLLFFRGGYGRFDA